MSKRVSVPKRFTNNIETWLPNLNFDSYTFKSLSPTHDDTKKMTVCIGDVHGDPRGLITALRISSLIDPVGAWIGGSKRLILMGDILDGAERIAKNPTITPYDEILCMRIIITLKKEAQIAGGDVIWVLGNHDIMAALGNDMYLNPIQARGYGSKPRKEWFKPGEGILAFYMAQCGILAGKFGDVLVSHAGVLSKQLPSVLDPNGDTVSMRMWLLKNAKRFGSPPWFYNDAVMVHREYDV
jgi:hypothetical protein